MIVFDETDLDGYIPVYACIVNSFIAGLASEETISALALSYSTAWARSAAKQAAETSYTQTVASEWTVRTGKYTAVNSILEIVSSSEHCLTCSLIENNKEIKFTYSVSVIDDYNAFSVIINAKQGSILLDALDNGEHLTVLKHSYSQNLKEALIIALAPLKVLLPKVYKALSIFTKDTKPNIKRQSNNGYSNVRSRRGKKHPRSTDSRTPQSRAVRYRYKENKRKPR